MQSMGRCCTSFEQVCKTTKRNALALADTYRMLNNRISMFTRQPLTSFHKISLQRRLDQIGKAKCGVARETA